MKMKFGKEQTLVLQTQEDIQLHDVLMRLNTFIYSLSDWIFIKDVRHAENSLSIFLE